MCDGILLSVQDGYPLCVNVASPSLSTQNKAVCQRLIKNNEEVSDECSSGMMRMVCVVHSILVLCVQAIASYLCGIEDLSTSIRWRRQLRELVHEYKEAIQNYKLQIQRYETEIKQIETAIENKGKFIS